MSKKSVHIVGTGTIGEPLIGLFSAHKEEFGIDEVTFHKNSPREDDRPKIKQLLKSLREMRRCDETAKAVVFSQFGATHLAVVKALEKAKIGVVQIRGNMTQKARANALEKFIKEDQNQVK